MTVEKSVKSFEDDKDIKKAYRIRRISSQVLKHLFIQLKNRNLTFFHLDQIEYKIIAIISSAPGDHSENDVDL